VSIYFHSIIDQYSPRIIISLADNNRLLLNYASAQNRSKVVLIQNALRRKSACPFSESRIPIYFSFGHIEKRRLSSAQHDCDALIPNGSLALGYALASSKKPTIPHTEISFISSYRLFNGSFHPTELSVVHRNLFLMTLAFTKHQDITLRVIIKTKDKDKPEQSLEFDYFSNLAGQTELDFITSDRNSNEFNSYYGAMSSDLIVHCHSTLGFEMLSVGKKVLFGSSMSPALISEREIDDYFDELPSEVKVENDSEIDFTSKLTRLLSFSESEYKALVALPSHNLLSMPKQDFPQTVISKTLSELLHNSDHQKSTNDSAQFYE